MVTIKISGNASALDELIRQRIPVGERKASVDVGFMDGARHSDSGELISAIAAFNEYGTGTSPPRSFMRSTVNERADAWAKNLVTALKATGYRAVPALTLVGIGMEEDIQDKINTLTQPPLAPSTIARKGFDKPLIDKGEMLRGVTHKVNEGE